MSSMSLLSCFFSIENRYLPPLLITTILLVGQLSYGLLESLSRTLLAIGAAMFFDLILGRSVYGRVPHLASSYITGISVGILARSPEHWPYALTSAIAITSKYVIRWHGAISTSIKKYSNSLSDVSICAVVVLVLIL